MGLLVLLTFLALRSRGSSTISSVIFRGVRPTYRATVLEQRVGGTVDNLPHFFDLFGVEHVNVSFRYAGWRLLFRVQFKIFRGPVDLKHVLLGLLVQRNAEQRPVDDFLSGSAPDYDGANRVLRRNSMTAPDMHRLVVLLRGMRRMKHCIAVLALIVVLVRVLHGRVGLKPPLTRNAPKSIMVPSYLFPSSRARAWDKMTERARRSPFIRDPTGSTYGLRVFARDWHRMF